MPSINGFFHGGSLDFSRAEEFCRRASSEVLRQTMGTLLNGDTLSLSDEVLIPAQEFILLCKSELRAREVFSRA